MNNYDYYIGIDVGVEGGIAIIDNSSQIFDVFKTPTTVTDFLKVFIDLKEAMRILDKKIMCLVEKTNAMPHDGAASARKLGYVVGVTHTALEAAGIPYDEVSPKVWQGSFCMKRKNGMTYTEWKNALKGKASQLFPDIQCTLWNSDALLIAEYCKRTFK